MKRITVLLIALALACLPSFASASKAVRIAEARHALVIGNGAYATGPLKNPGHDASDMAKLLKELKFSVTLLRDADQRTMEEAIRKFQRTLKRGGVGLFYFSGHGMQIAGRNYLIPVKAGISQESDVKYEAVDAGRVLDAMETAGNGMNIVILDACRDNPFAKSFRSASRGLAKMDAPKGTFIAYSTAPGDTASDGSGRNSPYTRALLKHVPAANLPIELVFKKVRQETDRLTRGKQVPWESTSLTGDFYFRGGGSGTSAAAPAPEEREEVAMARPPAPPREDRFTDAATGMEFVLVRGGCFRMGDTMGDGDADEKPVHEVCVDDFYMGKHEVTVGQFRRFVEDTGYRTDAEKNAGGLTGCWAQDFDDREKEWNWRGWADWRNPNKYQANRDDHPVACVSWNDAQAFAGWLSRKEGRSYRLPTEAEWEYAARGGTSSRNYWGAGKDDACTYANVADRTPLGQGRNWTIKHECSDGHAFASPVGQFRPNAFGLYDMMGNVWEWCADWYGDKYYGESGRSNPGGPASGQYRVARGGSWGTKPAFLRASDRDRNGPVKRNNYYGFRLLLPAP
ncbi:MAG TPA: SUMF1/EgtB/PvdO family nonheme iron enzyme [Syntrophales bacterium]|nr:SUMF1/EgtB/PvdO family nonheme iron enzyme [Syntrophales bacterium]